MLGRRLYSPRLNDIAWPENDQIIFLIFHTFRRRRGFFKQYLCIAKLRQYQKTIGKKSFRSKNNEDVSTFA